MSSDESYIEMSLHQFEIAPTDAKLKSDCIKLVEHMSLLWQGDVEFVVIATRKDGAFNYAWASTVGDGEKQKKIFDEVRRRTSDAGPRASEVVLGDQKK